MRAKFFKGTVLLITGDERLETHLEEALLQAGYGIRTARGQEEAIKEFRSMTPAIVIVDRRQSGFSRLSQEMPVPPSIMTITYHAGQCDEQHCVMDLEDGATRAVCNTSPALIVGLVGAILRRRRWDQQQTTLRHYVSNGVTVDLEKCEVTIGSTPVHLSRTEFRILQSLITTPGHFLSRKALLDRVWGEGFAIFHHVLDVHVWSLRRKLDPARANPELITTIKGSGFRLRPASQVEQPLCINVFHHAALTSVPRISNANPQLVPLVRTSVGGCIHSPRQRTQSISTRYRSKPSAVSLELHKHKRSSHLNI